MLFILLPLSPKAKTWIVWINSRLISYSSCITIIMCGVIYRWLSNTAVTQVQWQGNYLSDDKSCGTNCVSIKFEMMIACLNIVHNPDSNIHGANMGTIWGRQDPGGSHVVHMNLAIWEVLILILFWLMGSPALTILWNNFMTPQGEIGLVQYWFR